jgi:hypothetical protein
VSSTTDAVPAGANANQVAQLSNGGLLRYDNVNFGTTGSAQFQARVASGAASGVSGLIEVVLDSPTNAAIGSFALGNSGGWNSWRTVPANITRTTGTHTVYLRFTSGVAGQPFASLHWFTFPTS